MAPSFFSWTPTSFVSKIKNPLLYFNNNNPIPLTVPSNDTTNVAIDSQDQHGSSSPPNPSSSDRSVSSGGASGGQSSASGGPERPSSGPSSSSPSRSGSGSGSASVPRVSSNAGNLSEVDGLRVIFGHFDENNDGYLSGSELRTSLRMFGIETEDDEVAALVEEADTNNNGTLDFDEFVSFYYNLNQGMSLSKVSGPSPDPSGAAHGVDVIEAAVRSTRIGDALGLGGSQISTTPNPIGEESQRKCENGTTIGANSIRSPKDEEEEEEEEGGGGEGGGEEDLRDAFNLFDKNGDGFICAEELQSVLNSMGLKQGKLLIDCQNMIRTFDLNGDGQISFDEFKQMMLIGFN